MTKSILGEDKSLFCIFDSLMRIDEEFWLFDPNVSNVQISSVNLVAIASIHRSIQIRDLVYFELVIIKSYVLCFIFNVTYIQYKLSQFLPGPPSHKEDRLRTLLYIISKITSLLPFFNHRQYYRIGKIQYLSVCQQYLKSF